MGVGVGVGKTESASGRTTGTSNRRGCIEGHRGGDECLGCHFQGGWQSNLNTCSYRAIAQLRELDTGP